MFVRLASLVLVPLLAFGCFEPPAELDREHDFVVGPEGGRFAVDGGVTLFFPVGAVTEPLSINVTRVGPSAYAPGSALGDAWLLEPEGVQFGQLIQVTLPLTKDIPAGARLRVARAPNKSRFFDLLFPTRTLEGLQVQTSHFSVYIPVAVFEDGGIDSTPDGGARDAGVESFDAGNWQLDAG